MSRYIERWSKSYTVEKSYVPLEVTECWTLWVTKIVFCPRRVDAILVKSIGSRPVWCRKDINVLRWSRDSFASIHRMISWLDLMSVVFDAARLSRHCCLGLTAIGGKRARIWWSLMRDSRR